MRKKIFDLIRSDISVMLNFLIAGDLKCAVRMVRSLLVKIDCLVELGLFDFNFYIRIEHYLNDIINNYHSVPFPDTYLNDLISRNNLRRRGVIIY